MKSTVARELRSRATVLSYYQELRSRATVLSYYQGSRLKGAARGHEARGLVSSSRAER
jgi:hypothetical protein